MLKIKDYRLTIPRERLAEMQHVLEQDAKEGHSPHPFVPGQDLQAMLLVTWGLDAFANRPDRALTAFQIPPGTAMLTLDRVLFLIADFVGDKSYFEVVSDPGSGDGEQEFYYHFERGRVVKEERITIRVPAELAFVQEAQRSCSHPALRITLWEENAAAIYAFQRGRIHEVEEPDERTLLDRFTATCPDCRLNSTYEREEDAPPSVQVRYRQARERHEGLADEHG